MRRDRFVWVTHGVMALLVLFFVYYLYRALGQLIPFAFTKPHLWEEHWMIRGTVTIPLGLRLAYFLVWMISISATALMLFTSFMLVNLVRQGAVFELRTIRAFQQVGISAFVAGVAIIVANSLWPWMITMMNETEKRGLSFGYDSSEAGVALLGAGIFLLGWVLKYAVSLRQENEEFV